MNELVSEISTFTHLIMGISLFAFAFFEVFAALKPGNKIPAIGSLVLFACGISGIAFMFDKSGGNADSLLDLMSSNSIFMLFFGLNMLVSTSGLIGIMQFLSKNMPFFWKFFQTMLFFCVAAAFYVYPQFYPSQEPSLSMQIHHMLCYAIAAGAAISLINALIKNRALAFTAVFFFFISGTLLVQFKEDPLSFNARHDFVSVPSDKQQNTETLENSEKTAENAQK